MADQKANELSDVTRLLLTAVLSILLVLLSYAIASIIGPTPIPSFVILPVFAVNFGISALFVYFIYPSFKAFIATASIMTVVTAYGRELVLHGSEGVTSPITLQFLIIVLIAILLGGTIAYVVTNRI